MAVEMSECDSSDHPVFVVIVVVVVVVNFLLIRYLYLLQICYPYFSYKYR